MCLHSRALPLPLVAPVLHAASLFLAAAPKALHAFAVQQQQQQQQQQKRNIFRLLFDLLLCWVHVAAVALTGLIWSRYSMVIKPRNWNLFSGKHPQTLNPKP